MNNLVKPIKTALAKKYGYKNVSVKNGRGTAWGWVEAVIKALRPVSCTCSPVSTYCQSCREILNAVSNEAREIAKESLRKENLKFYTYSSDDGYDTEREQFLVQVNIINQ